MKRREGGGFHVDGAGVVQVEEKEGGRNVALVRNPLLVSLSIAEVLLAASLCGLNYCFRYDPYLREDASLINWEGVRLSCADLPRFSYPYLEANNQTFSSSFSLPESVFYSCAIVVPCCLVLIVETVRWQFPGRRIKNVESCYMIFPQVIRRILRFILTFIMGGAGVGLLVAVTKLAVVSPRPHLLGVCGASGPEEACWSPANLTWAPDAECEEGEEEEVHEALRAFPSYHATLAAYSGVWACLYVMRAGSIPGVYGGRLVVMGGVLSMMLLGATHGLRVYTSSFVDVTAGVLIGTIAAIFVLCGLTNGFKERKWRTRLLVEKGRVGNGKLLPLKPLGGSPNLKSSHKWKEVELGDMDSSSDGETDDFGTSEFGFGTLTVPADSFPIIPRATTLPARRHTTRPSTSPSYNHHNHHNHHTTTTQAVNRNLQSYRPSTPQPPPPPPPPPPPAPPIASPSGPPPSYSRPEHQNHLHNPWTSTSSYNIPRQRYSAPAPTPRAPAYESSPRSQPHRTRQTQPLTAYAPPKSQQQQQQHQHQPSSRILAETSSYF